MTPTLQKYYDALMRHFALEGDSSAHTESWDELDDLWYEMNQKERTQSYKVYAAAKRDYYGASG